MFGVSGKNALTARYMLALALGVYACLVGMTHGYYELQQGATAPQGILIQAMGAPCQAEEVAHACLPAMTLLPTFQIAGGLTLLVALLIGLWILSGWENRYFSPVLVGLGVILMLVGGGFFPPFYAFLAAGSKIPQRGASALAPFYPALPLLLAGWILIQLLFSQILNDFLLSTGGLLLPLEFAGIILAIFSAIAHDTTTPRLDVGRP